MAEPSPGPLFTEALVQTLWEEKTPLKLLGTTLVPVLAPVGPDYTESDSELIQILAEYFLHSLAFAKLDLKASNQQAGQWLELLFEVLRESIVSQRFEAEQDFQRFKELLLKLCTGLSPLFTKQQTQALMDHFTVTYLKQIRLYRMTFTATRPRFHVTQSLFIEKPMSLPSLKEAKLVQKQEEQKEVAQEKSVEQVESKAKMPLEDRLQGLKYPDVDEESQKTVAAKVAAAKAALTAKMAERQKRLEARISEAERDLKKRRK